jgi:hypothetical protein
MVPEELKLFTHQMVNWLSNSEICSEDGAVYSWTSSDKPGYIYFEIIGYYVKTFSYLYLLYNEPKYLAKAITSADYLSKNLNKDGSVGREKFKYVFDTAICFSGLIALSKVSELSDSHKNAMKKMIEFVYNSLQKKELVYNEQGLAVFDKTRWSLSYGSLLIKNTMALIEAAEYFNDEKYKVLAESLTNEIMGAFKENHFTINKEQDYVYTHPHCYATEGLIFLTSKGYSQYNEPIQLSAEWLAKQQNKDGSLYNWHFKENVELEKQGDATSQAIRIWLFADSEKYKENIVLGTSFLRKLQHQSEGLVYNMKLSGETSSDVNSWVTMFALQSVLWQYEKPNPGWIV